MIKGNKEISEIFSIFHDGVVVAYHITNDSVKLEIEISYLAQRIIPTYTKFLVSLQNARDFSFNTWLRDSDDCPSTFNEVPKIFAGEPDILNSEVKNGSIEVTMNQSSTEFDYCGGTLSFKADSASVTDEGGKEYTIRELGQICEDYWNEWENTNKP